MVDQSLRDRVFSSEPTYLTDLDLCQPQNALSPDPAPRRWRTLEYTTDEMSGVMLMAGPETAAPEVRYPLNARGWHAVSIGVFGDHRESVGLLLKLSGEDTFSVLMMRPMEDEQRAGQSVTPAHRTKRITELFWRAVDITGQDLVFGQTAWRVAAGDGVGSLRSENTGIAYIKLVALSDPEVDAIKADRARTDASRLFAHNDSHGFHFSHRTTTAEEIRRNLECFRDTDFSRIYWEAGSGDSLNYFSKIGRVRIYPGVGDFMRQGDRMHSESWNIFWEKGIDPVEAALGHAHDVGLEFHASYRVAGFHYPPPGDHNSHGPTFYKYHPDLRGVDRAGNRTPRMSYSYPEVRGFVVSLLREMATYPIDGICILYNRRPPLVEYEPPVVEGFKAEYGDDPRRLDDDDPRWLSCRARTLTQFHREVREAMDAAATEQGRSRIAVSAIVMRNEQENLANAMDLKAWIDEGLVDTIIPYSSAPNLDSVAEGWTDVRDAEYFVSLTAGTRCTLALNIMPRQMSPEAYRKRAAALYAAGVENLFFWDCTVGRADYSTSWDALRRLGHRDELSAWTSEGEPALASPAKDMTKLGDWDLSYDTPG